MIRRGQARIAAFLQGLQELGWSVGRNVRIDIRWSAGDAEDTRKYAAELVASAPDILLSSGTPAAAALQMATRAVPIVFTVVADPVGAGFVDSLSRPGGNVTGVTTMNVEMTPKRLQVLRELLPMTSIMAVLHNPINISLSIQTIAKQLQAVAPSLGLQMIPVLEASTEPELDSAFSSLVQQGAGGLVISADTFFSGKSQELAQLALRNAIPAISPYREFAVAGGLMSYGGSITELYRLVGVYTGRILKGEQPGDLPVQQVTKVELVINLKTAKALGLTVPQSLIGRADEIIE